MLKLSSVWIYTERFPIVRDISLHIEQGQTLALLGESGSGKTTLALFLAGVLREGLEARGRVFFRGKEVFPPSEPDWRGKKAGLILQDPYQSFDPRQRIEEAIADGLRYHLGIGRKEALNLTYRYLEKVHFPLNFARLYPHQLSGGMLQRASIAAVISLEPEVIIADEPTSALDRPLRKSILELFRQLIAGRKTLLYITHSVDEAIQLADRIAVLYAGYILELMEKPFRPLHPYTRKLFSMKVRRGDRLEVLEGFVPHPSQVGEGCPFAPRCWLKGSACDRLPPVRRINSSLVRCWYVEGDQPEQKTR